MTDKLHCPFCGAELESRGDFASRCVNPDCWQTQSVMSNRLWQALIDGKKAQDALKAYKTAYEILDKSILELLPQLNHLVVSGHFQTKRQQAALEIAAITKQEE